MGGIEHECPACKGIGFVSPTSNHAIEDNKEIEKPFSIINHRGEIIDEPNVKSKCQDKGRTIALLKKQLKNPKRLTNKDRAKLYDK